MDYIILQEFASTSRACWCTYSETEFRTNLPSLQKTIHRVEDGDRTANRILLNLNWTKMYKTVQCAQKVMGH